jgi:hypothetical protein
MKNFEWSHRVNADCLCPKIKDEELEQISLFGNTGSANFKNIFIKVYPCVEKTPGFCNTPNINKKFTFYFMRTLASFDPDNFENPINVVPSAEEGLLMKRLNTVVRKISFDTVFLKDDRYDYQERVDRASYIERKIPSTNSVSRSDALNPSTHVCTIT